MKLLEWIASSRKDLRGFPDPVRRKLDYALYRAQQGGTAESTKPLKGLGAGVVEVIADYDGNAIALSIQYGSPGQSTYCMSFRRNPRRALPRRGPRSISSERD